MGPTTRQWRCWATALARGVALGPGGIGDQQRYPQNRRYIDETRCAWVRLWAEWPKLQPRADRAPDFGPLDAEIAAARADGVKVMLTSWRYPGWANGRAERARQGPDLQPAGRPVRGQPVRPLDGSAGRARRRRDRGRQRAELPALAAGRRARRGRADDGDSARGAADDRLLVGPATADRRGSGPNDTDHLEFARALLDELDRIGFRPGDRTAWSHHNYGDVESDSDERIAAVRALLGERWPGVPMLVTESGARLTTIARDDRALDGTRCASARPS